MRSVRLCVAALIAIGLVAGCAAPAGATARGRDDRTSHLVPACALVPAESIATETGIGVVEGVPGGDPVRSTCSYPASGSGPGLTVGVSAAQRYDERVAGAQRSTHVVGSELPGLGRRARFLFGAARPRGGLGVLVVQDAGMTLEVIVQGLADRARAQETATAVARAALRSR